MNKIKQLLLVLLLMLLASCNSSDNSLTFLRPNDVIVAFGDSLTSGVGAKSDMSYPAQLRRLLGRKVVNSGIPGEISSEGASRLPGVLDQHQPELLIICHGGNDILRKLDREDLRNNLRRMYEAANQRGIEVVIVTVPQLGLGLHDVKLYQELGDELKIPVLSETLGELLSDSRYKSDPIHLNRHGYEKLAEGIADLLAKNGALQ